MRFPITFAALVAMGPAVLTAQITTTVVKAPAVPATPTPTPRGAAGTAHQSLVPAMAPPAKPARLDFPALFSGEKNKLTVSITSPGSGYMTGALSGANFHIIEVRAIGEVSSSLGKGKGAVDARTVTSRTISVPWQLSVAAGTLVEFDVAFEPVFSLENVAGPKTASLTLTGPGAPAGWRVAVPMSATFNGIRTGPILILPEKDFLEVADPFESVKKFVVRLVGTGEDVSGRIVWPSASPGLKVVPYTNIHLGASETREFTVPVGGTGGHTDKTPLDGTVAFEFLRKGESVAHQTVAVAFRVTFVPGYVNRDVGPQKCNGVQLTRASVYLTADGTAKFGVWLGSEARDSHFEVYFPQAGRTLFHTTAPANLNKQILVRVEESGPSGLASAHPDSSIWFDGKFNPGPPGSLDRYRALLNSTAELRCW